MFLWTLETFRWLYPRWWNSFGGISLTNRGYGWIWMDMESLTPHIHHYPSISPVGSWLVWLVKTCAKHPWLRRPFAAITQPGKLCGACRTAVRCCPLLSCHGWLSGNFDQLGHLLTEKIKKDQPWSRLASTCHVKNFSLKCWFVNISNIIYMQHHVTIIVPIVPVAGWFSNLTPFIKRHSWRSVRSLRLPWRNRGVERQTLWKNGTFDGFKKV